MLGMEILVIIGLILLLLVLWIISVQRKFAVMDGNIQNAMNQIGVQISSRFDALFAVLDLMKGYAADDIQPLVNGTPIQENNLTEDEDGTAVYKIENVNGDQNVTAEFEDLLDCFIFFCTFCFVLFLNFKMFS